MPQELTPKVSRPPAPLEIVVDGIRYERVVTTTHWIQPGGEPRRHRACTARPPSDAWRPRHHQREGRGHHVRSRAPRHPGRRYPARPPVGRRCASHERLPGAQPAGEDAARDRPDRQGPGCAGRRCGGMRPSAGCARSVRQSPETRGRPDTLGRSARPAPDAWTMAGSRASAEPWDHRRVTCSPCMGGPAEPLKQVNCTSSTSSETAVTRTVAASSRPHSTWASSPGRTSVGAGPVSTEDKTAVIPWPSSSRRAHPIVKRTHSSGVRQEARRARCVLGQDTPADEPRRDHAQPLVAV